MNVLVELCPFIGDWERYVCTVGPDTMLIFSVRRKMWLM